MRKLILIISLILPIIGFSKEHQLTSFDEVMAVLKEGKEIRAVFHYNECQLISDNEIADDTINAIGGMVIDTWEYFAKGSIRNKEAFVVASTSKLIANPKGNGYVYNYAKVKIKASGVVKITACYIHPITMEEKMTENFFTVISKDTVGGAFFYISK